MKEVLSNYREAIEVLAFCIFNPDMDNLLRIINEYNTNQNKHLFAKNNGTEIVGVIGIEVGIMNEIEIQHIAVKTGCRNQRIGAKMVSFIEKKFANHDIFAETDNDAVGFYKKQNFDISVLPERFSGVKRFVCSKSRCTKCP